MTWTELDAWARQSELEIERLDEALPAFRIHDTSEAVRKAVAVVMATKREGPCPAFIAWHVSDYLVPHARAVVQELAARIENGTVDPES